MKKTWALFSIFCIFAVFLVKIFSDEPQQVYAFVFGLLLFTLNLVLLGFLAGRLLAPKMRHKSNAFTDPLFLALVPIKFGIIGAGTYVALIPLSFSPWFFVGGAAAGLGLATIAFSVRAPRHFKTLLGM